MLTNKNQRWLRIQLLLLMIGLVALTGCMPAGPRALLRGKRLIEQGKYAAAVDELQTAISLIPTNAQAWNYLGLAYHHAGQSSQAIDAYQRAHHANPDLAIVHYNLGCLLLEMNRPDTLEAARDEFTAYTLQQRKSVDGWIKLATVQMRLGDYTSAEISLRQALQFQPQNAEALNDMGVILMRRRKPRDAVNYFANALQQQPTYGPAELNMGIADIYLNNRPAALQKYQEYLEQNPRAANWQAVSAAAQQLDAELNPKPIYTNTVPPAAPQTNLTRPENVAVAPKTNVTPPSRTVEPVRIARNTMPTPTPAQQPVVPPKVNDGVIGEPPDQVIDTQSKPGFFQRLNPFRRSQPANPAPSETVTSESRPELPVPSTSPGTTSADSGTVPISVPQQVRSVSVPHYPYLPAQTIPTGNHVSAERMYNLGVAAQQDGRIKDAAGYFRSAVMADPAYFDAQAALGGALAQTDDLGQALRAYELAVSLNPDSFMARFNFALLLRRANYIQDAAQQLERLVVSHPADEAPEHLAVVHLTLANLYSEQFHQNAAARKHYLKVLELDPQNPQATDIRFWLRNNP